MNKTTREKIAKKAKATVKARHAEPETVTETAATPAPTPVAKVKAPRAVKEQAEAVAGKLPKLPRIPRNRGARKPKPLVDCACGCGNQTRATWAPGHDARARGWAIRVERGICSMDDVPVPERKGAQRMIEALNAEAKQPSIKIVKKASGE